MDRHSEGRRLIALRRAAHTCPGVLRDRAWSRFALYRAPRAHRSAHPGGDPEGGILDRIPEGHSEGTATIMLKPIFLLSAVLVAIGLTPLPLATAGPSGRHVHIQARSYEYSPATIDVQRGDRVTLELESTDTVHGLRIDGYDLEVRSSPGQPALLTFLADRPGVFRLRCSVTCGPLHPFMIGRLRVAPEAGLWRVVVLAIMATIVGVGLGTRRGDRPGQRPMATAP